MSQLMVDLVKLLAPSAVGVDVFDGESQDLGWKRLFGGQVLGQALYAVSQTVPEDRLAHSLHAYFIRPGLADRGVRFAVERTRDGGSFATRRVLVSQSDETIFEMSASFHKEEPGFDHQDSMPDAPDPDSLQTSAERLARMVAKRPELEYELNFAEEPFDIRMDIEQDDPLDATPIPPRRGIWFRAKGRLELSRTMQQCLLAYVSDHRFLTTSLLPHGRSWRSPELMVTSLDHSIWFHRPFDVCEWLLYDVCSPSAASGRGFAQGRVFNRAGQLVASTAQEGLIRIRVPRAERG